MDGIEFDVTELNRLALDLATVDRRQLPRFRQTVRRAGQGIDGNAHQIVPRDTGFLANSLGMDVDPDGLGVTNGPTADYGAYVELGTSRMGPQAYMGPSFDREVPGFVDAVGELAVDVL